MGRTQGLYLRCILAFTTAILTHACVTAQPTARCQAGEEVRWDESFVPRTGTVRVPVLLVRPRNVPAPFDRAQYEKQYFGSWPTGSLHDYYDEVSYGKLDLVGDVSDWIELANEDVYYEGADGEAKWKALLEEAVQASGFDWSRYDADRDNQVDVVIVVHAENAGQCNPGSNNLKSTEYKYYNLTPSTDRRYLDTGFNGPDGKPICINEYLVVAGVNCLGDALNEIGGVAHEFGHALGLPDLEDQDGSAGGVGVWGLMGRGDSGGDDVSPERPSHLSAWSKVELGWVKPMDLTAEQDVKLPPAESNPVIYRFESDENLGVYYLLENRRRQGFDNKLPGEGLLIWRVDSTMVDYWKENVRTNSSWYSINDDDSNRGVQVVEADDAWEIPRLLSNGDAGDVFPGTTQATAFSFGSRPKNYSRKAICEIRSAGSEVRFRFVPDRTCTPEAPP